MFASMDKMRQDMMAGISEGDRAVMEQMMQPHMLQRDAAVVSSSTKQIAGYANACYQIGPPHESCVSEQLLEAIKSEMGKSYIMELQTIFGARKAPTGMRDPTQEAIVEISKKGFPMENRRRMAAIPGMNAAMLEPIPKEQRDQIMAQMGAAGAGQMQGSRVIKVDTNGVMPELDLTQDATESFEGFTQQTMGAAGGNRPLPQTVRLARVVGRGAHSLRN